MPATLYSDTGYTLSHLVERIRQNEISLPDIQRPYVWPNTKTRDLFDSLYRGYPVGTLLFWETDADVNQRSIGSGQSERIAKMLIVDGQQRLTSLYAVLTGQPVLDKNFESRHIRIAFRPSDETFEVVDATVKNNPEFIADITTLWDGSYKQQIREFTKRLAESREGELTDEEQDLLEERIDRVRDLRDFRFQVIVLSSDADEEQVSDIFVRINSQGAQLGQADFILTLMSVHWEEGRTALETFCRNAKDPNAPTPNARNPFIDPAPSQLLRASVGLAFGRARLSSVYKLLRGRDLETGEVSDERRVEQFDQLKAAIDQVLNLTNWTEFLKSLQTAGFRSPRQIGSENTLVYTYLMYLIAKRDFKLSGEPLLNIIARWFFMASTTSRYIGSFETQVEADLARLSQLERTPESFVNELDRVIRSNFTSDYWEVSLPNLLDTSAARSPRLAAYWAALNLLDAEVLGSKKKIRDLLDPALNPPKSIERHHLFPKNYLAKNGETSRKSVNAIANMAFMDWPENIKVSDSAPSEYWPSLREAMSDEQIKQQEYWHALPVGWEQLSFDEFKAKRRTLIAKVVRDGFEKLSGVSQDSTAPSSIDDLLHGESQRLEYKSTGRVNLHTGSLDKKMEHVVAKTVCGFLNAEGGTLLIGVDDDAEILGLDNDYKAMGSKANADGYELWLRQHLDNSLSTSTAGTVKINFRKANNKDVCEVSVAAAGKPVFTKPAEGGSGDATDFYVRIGNATRQMYGDELIEYRDDHWG